MSALGNRLLMARLRAGLTVDQMTLILNEYKGLHAVANSMLARWEKNLSMPSRKYERRLEHALYILDRIWKLSHDLLEE